MFGRITTPQSLVVILSLILGEASFPSSDCHAGEGPRIGLISKSAEHPAAFEAFGLPAAELVRLKSLEPNGPAFSRIFSVYVAGKTADASVPPVGGHYRVDGARLVFTPRYPPVPGLKYRAVLRLPAEKGQAGTLIEQELALPKEAEVETKPARVEQIYPSGDLLPENHLRFYIHFSQPIERGKAYEHLELLDEAGKPVELAFLELGEELWDPSGRRFTLLLDPGRIKQGLKPREEFGPILTKGRQYTLVVKPGWCDLRGRPLVAEFRKEFAVGPMIDKPINTKRWKFNAPRVGTADPLVIRFSHPLDHALLERTLTVVDGTGKMVPGRVVVADHERRWEFVPDSVWASGQHQLVVDTVLEDSAGNSIVRAFEVDQQHTITKSVTAETVTIPISLATANAASSASGEK